MSWATGWAQRTMGPASLRLELGGIAIAATVGPGAIISATAGGAAVALRSWQTVTAQLRVRVVGSPIELATLRAVRLGMPARLYCATTAGEEQVWTGPLRDTQTPQPGVVELIIDDASQWARSRYRVPPGGTSEWRDGLFAGAVLTTTTTSSYSVPDGTMAIADDPGDCFAELPDGAGRRALVEVEGPDGLYYLAATGYTTTSLSGLTLQWIPPGNTAPATPSHSTVRIGPLISGSPQDILLRVLLSNGSGIGGYNILDATQGLSIPGGVVDLADVARLTTVVGARLADDRYTFSALSVHADPEGGPLLAWAAALGLWLCPRQGLLTVRAACDPYDAATWLALYAGEVTDDVLIEVGTHTTRAPDMMPEYLGASIPATLGSTSYDEWPIYDPAVPTSTRGPQTWPVGPARAALPWPGGGDGLPIMGLAASVGLAEWDAHVEDVARRLCPWLSRQCEAVEVSLVGEALGWCAGDLVSVTSRAIPGPVSTGGVAVGRRAMWAPETWDWRARVVSGTLYLLSDA